MTSLLENSMKQLKKKPRNHLYNHPLLHKGGAHEKTHKAKRRKDKVKLKKEWLSENYFYLKLLKIIFK